MVDSGPRQTSNNSLPWRELNPFPALCSLFLPHFTQEPRAFSPRKSSWINRIHFLIYPHCF